MRAPSASIESLVTDSRSVSAPAAGRTKPGSTTGPWIALTAGLVGIALIGVSAASVVWITGRGALALSDDQRMLWAILGPSAVMAFLSVGLAWSVGHRVAAAMPPQVQEAAGGPRADTDKDALTGLLDRRTFLTFADDALLYFKRYHRSAAVLIVDIDRFKSINDAYGTSVGNHVLAHIADVLDLSLRKTDKISRFFNDQFVILLREISEADTIALANRMRRAVEDLGMRFGDQIIPVTISIGATLVSQGDTKIESVIERAGKALLAAKETGRNCVNIRAAAPKATLHQAA